MRRPNTQTKIHMNPISHYLKPCELISHKQLTRRPEHSETGSMIVWQLSASTLKRLITHLQSSNMRWIFLNHRRAARQLWWHLRRRSSSGCGHSSCRSVAHQHCRSGCWSTHPLLCLCLRMVGGGHCRGTGMMVMMMKVVEVVMTGRGPWLRCCFADTLTKNADYLIVYRASGGNGSGNSGRPSWRLCGGGAQGREMWLQILGNKRREKNLLKP